MVKRTYIIWAAVIAAVAGLLSQFPLAWVVPKELRPLGTIWQGQIVPVPMLGPATVSTRINRIFKGEPPAEVSHASSGLTYTVKAGLGGIKTVDYRSSLSGLPIRDPRLANFSGIAELTLKDVKVNKSGCQAATGAAFTDVLSANKNRLGWSGPELAGPVRCEDGNLIVDLSGDKDGDSVQLNLELRPSGTYHALVTARLARDEMRALLGFAGFVQSGNSYTLDEEGSWK